MQQPSARRNWLAASACWRPVAWVLGIVLALAVGASGAGEPIDEQLSAMQATILSRPATGDLHLVEIDKRSIDAIDRWPWPRGNYAKLIARLHAAGAKSIAFDVDLSSPSDPHQDALLGRALAHAGGGVVLPTFRQAAGGGRSGWIDSLPIAPLRDHAALAAVTVEPGSDGVIRRAPLGAITAGVPRPSLSAMLAGRSGVAGSSFPIDFAIDPASIPRHSFIDIRDGRFDPAVFSGKKVLVGATAVEIGDRYAVPRFSVIPGVVIQALAAETLARGEPLELGWLPPLLFAAVFGWLVIRARSRSALVGTVFSAPILLFSAALIARGSSLWLFTLSPALALLTSTVAATVAMRAIASLRRRQARDQATGMPNRLALRHARLGDGACMFAAARISEFDKLSSALGPSGVGELVRRINQRVALVTEGASIYRVEDRVLAWPVLDQEDVEHRLAGLRAAMLNPVEVHGRRVDVLLAFGVGRGTSDDAEQVVARAMLAADHALAAGTSWHFHADEDDAEVERELSLLGELDQAVSRGEIDVVYQPKLDLAVNRIASVEALVRWHHPARGLLRPDLFIPLAERNGRIAGLTLHVLARTIADLQRWQAAGYTLTGAVNISTILLSSADFIRDVRLLIDQSGVAPASLIFEVTESAAMTDPDAAVQALTEFRSLGIAVSIDDYGTGQSTLSYIRRLPVSELKIDRSFVQHAHTSRSDAVLVRSTIELAHELGIKVVAEGVEDAGCLAFLRATGCDMVQGYYLSKPIPAQDIQGILQDGTRFDPVDLPSPASTRCFTARSNAQI